MFFESYLVKFYSMLNCSAYLQVLFVLLPNLNFAQKVVYSDFEKKDFDRFRFDVIAKKDEKIIVYKAVYYKSLYSVTNRNPNRSVNPYVTDEAANASMQLVSSPGSSIMESSICIYDEQMRPLNQNLLPLPKEISGVHFLVYEDYLYMFYQYLKGHTIFCMAAKIGMDGNMIGEPIEMDRTEKVYDFNYQSEIYTVINSENKKHIVALKMLDKKDLGNTLTCISFDELLHPYHRFSQTISETGHLRFTEYNLDDGGNLIFIGLSTSKPSADESNCFLFRINDAADKIIYHPLISDQAYPDYPRLVIDNNNQKYIVVSFYSKTWGGNIKGLNVHIWDAKNDMGVSASNILFDDSISAKNSKTPRTAYDNFYLQYIQLRKDGGFIVQTQDLNAYPHLYIYDRWNYLQYFPSKFASDYIYYNPYEYYHYYPWSTWRYLGNDRSYNSSNTLFISCSPQGSVEWLNLIPTNQDNVFHATVGEGSFLANGIVYIIFNEKIKGKTYLVAQSIDAKGKINTDSRLKEHLKIKDVNNDYTYFPRFLKQVSSNEILLPCRKGKLTCLAKIEF